MSIEFDIKLTAQDMYRFNMYHTYTGFNGWFSIIIALMAFVVSFTTAGEVSVGYTFLYVVFGALFLVYIPVSLYLSAKRKTTKVKEFMKPLHYEVNEEGVTVSQDGEAATLPWKQIYKVISTKHNVLIYSSRINAYVIPLETLGEQYNGLKELSVHNLEKYRVRMK